MKKTYYNLLTFIFMIGIFSSCATIPHFEHSEYTYSIDLSKYSDKDFLFTSDGYSGKYKSCGFVEGELFPEVKRDSRMQDDTFNEDEYNKIDVWLIEKIKVDEIIDNIYKKSKSINANAVINLKIVKKRNPRLNSYPEYEKVLVGISDGYFISGFAIKRID